MVSERIRGFIEKKRKQIQQTADARDKTRESEVKKLEGIKEVIKNKDEDGKIDIDNMKALCDEAEDERRERGSKDDEEEAM